MKVRVGDNVNVNFGAQGGLPPYHYQLETGNGFPPQGLVLDLNGSLTGIPKIARTYSFGVCVVDTAGKSDCSIVVMVVEPANQATPVPAPVQPAEQVQLSISDNSCIQAGTYSDGSAQQVVVVSGSMSGPVGSILSVFGATSNDDGSNPETSSDCGNWSKMSGWQCTRKDGQPYQSQYRYLVPPFTHGRIETVQNMYSDYSGNYSKTLDYNQFCN